MKALIAATLALTLAACGGGSSDTPDASQPKPGDTTTPQVMKISYYGKPLANVAVATHAMALRRAEAATGASDAQAAASPIQPFIDALAAQGVTAEVNPAVIDGTTLHQIVMGENNGLPPTDDQFTMEPNEMMVAYFELDDMKTPASDPNQQAALAQYCSDIRTFTARAATKGKRVYIIPAPPGLPNGTSTQPYIDSIASAFNVQTDQCARGPASGNAIILSGLQAGFVQANGQYSIVTTDQAVSPIQDHLGADGVTPDDALIEENLAWAARSLVIQWYAAQSLFVTVDDWCSTDPHASLHPGTASVSYLCPATAPAPTAQ
jgi:hypothetical protein